MASYSVTRSKHGTIAAANTVDTVTVNGNFPSVEVINRGTVDLYFTVGDTATPTVGGDNTYIVTAGQALTVPSGFDPDVVRLISTGTPAFSVTGVK